MFGPHPCLQETEPPCGANFHASGVFYRTTCIHFLVIDGNKLIFPPPPGETNETAGGPKVAGAQTRRQANEGRTTLPPLLIRLSP